MIFQKNRVIEGLRDDVNMFEHKVQVAVQEK